MSFNTTIRNLGRLREILGVLAKYGFEEVITNSTLRKFVPESKRISWVRGEKPVFKYTRWERIRMIAEELGPTFIKLAQVLSIRPDLLPHELIKEFEKLQDHVPPFPYSKVREIIKRETGKEIEELFDNFEENVLASASIGQVHRARLKSGEEVVVKVQRPEVRDMVEHDIAIMKEGVKMADRYLKKQGVLNAAEIIKTFERTMLKELDYNNEARNIEQFRNFYKDFKNFYIPRAYRNISTDKVMVIEFSQGCKINDVRQIREWGLDPKKIAENGINIYLTQIFEYGYFHADPHPGNVFVRRDGVICLIDFGMVGRLMSRDKYSFAGVFISLAMQDSKRMAANLKKLAISDEISDMRNFQYDINEIIEDYAYLDVAESNIGEMTARLQKLMFDYKISVPGSVFLIFRAFAILEGIGKQVHPHFNTYEYIKPYGKKLIEDQFSLKNIANEISFRAEQVNELMTAWPRDIKEIISKLRKGKLHLEIEHQGYGYLLKKLDSLTTRIAFSLIIAALLVSSSIVITVPFPDTMISPSYGIPYLSVAGIWIAGGLFILLIYSIIRRWKYK